jgi:hypothetical protein
MRDIASLLFGDGAGELLDLLTGEGGAIAETGSDRQAADRVRRSGEWCGSTPERVTARDGGAGGRRGSPRPRI